VANRNDGGPGSLGQVAQQAKGPPDVLIPVRVHVVGKVRDKRINDYKRGVNLANRVLDGGQVGARDNGFACRPVNIPHSNRDNPGNVGAGGIEAGPDHLVKGVFGG
jgi:hypothetical protein